MKVIYDFGANNGDDIPYYLKKADLVVAVEGNPSLAELIKQRFAAEIAEKKLVVINCVLTDTDSSLPVAFYVNKSNHLLSQFPRPNPDKIDQFEEIFVQPQKASEIIQKYGEPFYIKIDIESYDQIILADIFTANIMPEFISAESHNIDIFAVLLVMGGYKAFKLVDGASVSEKYHSHPIQTLQGQENYSFPHHSAGPFGNDVSGPWLTANNLFYLLASENLGWKDIHATNTVIADPNEKPCTEKPLGIRDSLKALLKALKNRFL